MAKSKLDEMMSTVMHQRLQSSERLWLLRYMVKRPEQFPGRFCSVHPENVLRFHILRRQERQWGKTLKGLIAKWLEHYGYQRLGERIEVDGEKMKCDHYILSPDQSFVVLIEQKVRDDHDSSKARGQWRNNFVPKVRALYRKHGENLIAVAYFIDPTFRKNFNLYEREAQKLRRELGLVSIHIWYGRELFEQLPFANASDWDEMLDWLKRWHRDLPELPDVNWETDDAIAELQNIAQRHPFLWRQFAEQESLWKEGYIDVLFPTRKGLRAILAVLEQVGRKAYKDAAEALRQRLQQTL